MNITNRLLCKIELYCILHNVQKWNDVPYNCVNCKYLDDHTLCVHARREIDGKDLYHFYSSSNFRKFSDKVIEGGNPTQLKLQYGYIGCENWEKKSKI